MSKLNIFVEIGQKKTFVGAVDWPGWCRWGKDEEAAIQSLIEYGQRYAGVVRRAGLELDPPTEATDTHHRGRRPECSRHIGFANSAIKRIWLQIGNCDTRQRH